MKSLMLLLLISAVCFAQATWQVCVIKTVDSTVTQSCQDIPVIVVQSMTDAVQASNGVVKGKANLIFKKLVEWYGQLLDQYPNNNVAAAKAAQAAANDAVMNALKSAVPPASETEP